MVFLWWGVRKAVVALRKESVDRNEYMQAGTGILNLSLSARRAWIEICPTCQWRRSVKLVALRKESVDRNMPKIGTLRSTHSRSPQGERG